MRDRRVIDGTTFATRRHRPQVREKTPDAARLRGPGEGVRLRMDRTEFQRVLDDARTINPAPSATPDYLADNFHFNNEVVGNAEIGMGLGLPPAPVPPLIRPAW
jgi:hypothetical protein